MENHAFSPEDQAKTEGKKTGVAKEEKRCEQPQINELKDQILNKIPDLIWAKDMQDRFLFVNETMCNTLLLCDSPTDAVGKTDIYFAQRERAFGFEHTFGEVCIDSDEVVKKTRKPGRFFEFGLVRGRNVILDVHKSPLFDANGKMIGTVGRARNVSQEKEAENRHENIGKIVRTIADDLDSIAIQGYNENREVVLWNHASELLYGYSKSEALGRKLEDLIIPEDSKEAVIERIDRWLTHNERIPSSELILRNKHGEDVHVFSTHTMQATINGKEMYCIDIDLSSLCNAQQKVNRLEAVGRMRNQ